MKREIEIKYLLEDKQAADELAKKMKANYPDCEKTRESIVISYFYEKPESVKQVLDAAKQIVSKSEFEELQQMLNDSMELVVKARSIDDIVFFAVKGAFKGEDAVHAVNRIEFEVKVDTSLEEVNKLLVDSSIVLASKWYSERSFYKITEDMEMNIEFVSGYGYKAEIEILIEDVDSQNAEAAIRQVAQELSLQEASQELLGKMYEYYNQHWQEYFKTKKVFPDNEWERLGRN